MYFNKNNDFFHGIMFHHFHDNKTHLKSQGSISNDQFYKLIKYIGRENILNADVFFERFIENKLLKNNVCFTFDDGIKSQMDVALPVLEDLKIKSFFFVYTSIFEGKPDNLEIYRYFRTNYFESINKFYNEFYNFLGKNLENFFEKNRKTIKEKMIKHPVYTIEDIKFRLVRDRFLKQNTYHETMSKMMREKNFIPSKDSSKFFFNKEDLIKLNSLGHVIGLHAHNHNTLIEKLSYEEQKIQFDKCISLISEILNKPKNEIKVMSHPSGSYNMDTIEILKELGIKLGFKQIMKIELERGMKKINNSPLEIARQNHSEIIRKIV